MSTEFCNGIAQNVDISGTVIRTSLYIQSILAVFLAHIAPEHATKAYWSMNLTALVFISSSLMAAVRQEISLLDAIVVVYVLTLPVIASGYGPSWRPQTNFWSPTDLRKTIPPSLVVVNWFRLALTYAFALFVWAKAPKFGSGPAECDEATRFIFFGVTLSALGSGRVLNLIGWTLLTALFVWRTYKGKWALGLALRELLSGDGTIKPKEPLSNEFSLEEYASHTGESEYRDKVHRPARVVPALIAAWVIVMAELELRRNIVLSPNTRHSWDSLRVLSFLLAFVPVFYLCQALRERVCGQAEGSRRRLRLRIVGATGLKCARIESASSSLEDVELIRTPSPFAILTIDDTHVYSTFYKDRCENPRWNETFDVDVKDTSVIVVRVFDMKAGMKGGPALMGYATIAPLSMFPDLSTTPNARASLVNQTFPLMLDGEGARGNPAVVLSVSTDISGPPPTPNIPSRYLGPRGTVSLASTTVVRYMTGVWWRAQRNGTSATTRVETYCWGNRTDAGDVYCSCSMSFL